HSWRPRSCGGGRARGSGRPSAEDVTDAHPDCDLDSLEPLQNEHAKPPVEVDDRFGMSKKRPGSEVAENTDPGPTFLVDVLLGYTERVQVSGEAVVADRRQDLSCPGFVSDLEAALDEPFDLLVHRQPRLVVRDHEPPRKENQPAPCGNG